MAAALLRQSGLRAGIDWLAGRGCRELELGVDARNNVALFANAIKRPYFQTEWPRPD